MQVGGFYLLSSTGKFHSTNARNCRFRATTPIGQLHRILSKRSMMSVCYQQASCKLTQWILLKREIPQYGSMPSSPSTCWGGAAMTIRLQAISPSLGWQLKRVRGHEQILLSRQKLLTSFYMHGTVEARLSCPDGIL